MVILSLTRDKHVLFETPAHKISLNQTQLRTYYAQIVLKVFIFALFWLFVFLSEIFLSTFTKCNFRIVKLLTTTEVSFRTTLSSSQSPISKPISPTRTTSSPNSYSVEAIYEFLASGVGPRKTVWTAWGSGLSRNSVVCRRRGKIWQEWSGCTCRRSCSG